MTLFFASLKLMPTGTAVSIRYIAPIFAAVFALFFLREKIKPIQWLFFLGAFIGVVILKGIDSEIDTTGFLFAIGSALFTGLVFIIIRKIGSRDHPIVIVNYFMTISAVIAGILCINYWIQPIGYEWLLLLSLGVFGFFGQLYMTKALQQSETRLVAPLKYIEVVITMIAGVIWFAEDYSLLSLLGILLIIICLTLNVLVVRKS
jgi:drug/metabolite transporter (DMT)-like permease